MATRYDVSAVSPQGGYIAKQCPVRAQLNVLQPGARVEPDEVALLRMGQGIDFEADVYAELETHAAETGWVFLTDGPSRNEAIAQTITAMNTGVEVIAGGWLPVDEEGRRAGKPDLLVRLGGGYVPVDVKHHLTLDERDDGSALVSTLARPFVGEAAHRDGWSLRKSKDDALQLAHYRRMLRECGYAADSPLAGIIGKERIVAWYDLDAPMWQTPAKSDGRKRKTRTSMEVYDFEFDFRLDISAVAHEYQQDRSVDLLVLPVRRSECASCPWARHLQRRPRGRERRSLFGAGDPVRAVAHVAATRGHGPCRCRRSRLRDGEAVGRWSQRRSADRRCRRRGS